MARIKVSKCNYDYKVLKPTFFEIMDSIGGNRIEKGMHVLIKPNLLAPATPDQAMLTHPKVVRAAVEYALERGATVQLSDSPATGSFEKILKKSGIKDELEGLDVELKEFEKSVSLDVGEPFNKLEISEDALNADAIINLPKLKTHCQMLLTLGVKNLFGCVVGLRKPEWHMKTGVNREMFARLLVQVFGSLKPSFTVLDGILAMEGEGPGKAGTPRELGILMGADDAVSLDLTVCRMLGIPPDQLLTNKMAREMGFAQDPIELEGVLPRVTDFKMPEIIPIVFGPPIFHGLMRRYMVQRPVCDANLCRLCGECWSYCPPQAISRKKRGVRFDYDRCIRCYCCLEVCPHGAISAREPRAGQILAKTIRNLFRVFLSK